MESPSRFELTKEVQSVDETELGEVKVTPPTSSVATSTPAQPGSIPCRNGGCKSWTSRAESRMESPWHFLKTVFLISVIVALVIWVIVYTFLAQYQILWTVSKAEIIGQPELQMFFRLDGRSLNAIVFERVETWKYGKGRIEKLTRKNLLAFYGNCNWVGELCIISSKSVRVTCDT